MSEGLLGLLPDGKCVGEDHLLRQIAYSNVAGPRHHATGGALHPCYDFEHGRLARAVFTDECNSVSLIDDIIDVVEQDLASELDVQALNRNHGAKVVHLIKN